MIIGFGFSPMHNNNRGSGGDPVAAPVAAGNLADQTFTDDTGTQTVATAQDFTGAGVVYSLTTAPAGVTINSATGVVSIDTDAMAVQSATSIVVRATNAGGFASSGFSLTITAVVAAPTFASATLGEDDPVNSASLRFADRPTETIFGYEWQLQTANSFDTRTGLSGGMSEAEKTFLRNADAKIVVVDFIDAGLNLFGVTVHPNPAGGGTSGTIFYNPGNNTTSPATGFVTAAGTVDVSSAYGQTAGSGAVRRMWIEFANAAVVPDILINFSRQNITGQRWRHGSVFDAALFSSDPATLAQQVADMVPSGTATTAPLRMNAPSLTIVSSTEISATFAADPANGGSAITQRDLRYRVNAGAWTEVLDATSPVAITGLTGGDNVDVQARAVNAIGVGTWSVSASTTTTAPSASDVTLPAVSVGQYNNTVIDVSAHVPAGSRVYGFGLPSGLEVMAEAYKVIGAPLNAREQTTYSLLVIPAVTKAFLINIPLTVPAATGPVRNVGNITQLLAVPEFATSYTGPGCIINLSASANIDLTGQTFSNRFLGLTSMVVFRSADPANPARFVNNSINFAGGAGTTVGNVAFVNVGVHVPELNDPKLPGQALLVRDIIATAGQGEAENISFFNCPISSTVERAADRYTPSNEMNGFRVGAPCRGLTLWGNTFSNLFNGVFGAAENMLVARNTQTTSWGDGFRCSPPSKNGFRQVSTIMVCDNVLKESTSDGARRHADFCQMGGAGTFLDYQISVVELRGNTAMDPLVEDELPAIASKFINERTDVYTTSQIAGSADDTLYRMNTDAGDLTFALPAISTVVTTSVNQWEIVVQNYARAGNGVTVNPSGSDTINGASSYAINGDWKAVRLYKATPSATQWSIQVYGVGHQTMLLQDDGGLAWLNDCLIWYNVAVGGQRAGIVTEVNTQRVTVEFNTLIPAVYGDTDRDGIVDIADGQGASGWPRIDMGGQDPTSTMTVRNNICAGVSNVGNGTLTASNNFTLLDGTIPSTVTSRFVGEGARVSTRDAILAGAMLKPGTDLAGLNGDVGALHMSLTAGGYNFTERKPNAPGLAETTLTLSGTTPVDGGTGFAVDGQIVMQFNQQIIGGTGNITLRAGGSAVETFNVATGSGNNGGTVTFVGRRAILTPGANMATATAHSVRVDSTAIEAKVGTEFFAGISDDTTFNFTTSASAISFANAIAGGSGHTSDDYRTVTSAVAALGYTWMNASNSIDTGAGQNPNMSQATEDLLNQPGTYIAVADVIREASGLFRFDHRSHETAGQRASGMFYNNGAGSFGVGSTVDSTAALDVSTAYGQAPGTVTRLMVVYTNGAGGTRAMAAFGNFDAPDFRMRNLAVFRTDAFSGDPATREDQIEAMVP